MDNASITLLSLLAVGALLTLLFIFFVKKDMINPKYDERQKTINLQGNTLGFVITYFLAFVYILLFRLDFFEISGQFVATSFMFIPITVQICHNILKGGLFAINVSRKTYHILFFILGMTGFMMLALNIYHMSLEPAPLANFFSASGIGQGFLMAGLCLSVSLAYAYRIYLDKKEIR
ncbi:hypothetical protein [Streptococcus merionis]|uniref:Hypothetical membrane spanning protein n=1 Tax=Streptococcus merionis TaxID=400065 RepID=A0A239SS37_9STRE|nr:hypothetical protein [Streptococcus merionis]SNU88250.1 hypothetical membrane spanning protein [Streptococcus merionis]